MRKQSFPQESLFFHSSITGEFTNLYTNNSLFLTDSALGCGLSLGKAISSSEQLSQYSPDESVLT